MRAHSQRLRSHSLLIAAILVLVALGIKESGCNYTINGNPNVDLTQVTLSPIAATVTVGGTLQLTGGMLYGGSDSGISFSIVGGGTGQIVSNGSVATYYPAGNLPAPTTVTIRATSNIDPTLHADCLVTILNQNPIDTVTGVGVSINPIAVVLGRGKSQLFTTTVVGGNDTAITWSTYGSTADVTPTGVLSLPLTADPAKVTFVQATSHADPNVFALATVQIGNPTDSTICFTRTIQPILTSNCSGSGCHGSVGGRGGFNPDSYQGVIRDVRPGSAANSRVYQTMIELNANNRMPPLPQQALSAAQLRLIGRWIDQGAPNTSCN